MRNQEMQTTSGEHAVNLPQVQIRPLRAGEDATAFRTLNEEWITRYFTLEKMDLRSAERRGEQNPSQGRPHLHGVSRPTGDGCVALIPMGDGVYELSKMAVAPDLRGLGIGRSLLEFAVTQAKHIGARSLFLASNTKLQNAVHLYESIGFRHLPPERRPASLYTRANVFMEMPL